MGIHTYRIKYRIELVSSGTIIWEWKGKLYLKRWHLPNASFTIQNFRCICWCRELGVCNAGWLGVREPELRAGQGGRMDVVAVDSAMTDSGSLALGVSSDRHGSSQRNDEGDEGT